MQKFFLRKRFWVFVLCVIFVITLVPAFFPKIKKISRAIILFPAKIVSNTAHIFSDKRGLIKENKLLRKDIMDLSLEVEHYKELDSENKRLRFLLALKEKMWFDTICAQVIAGGPNNWEGTLIIDKGYVNGVKSDSAVCSARGLVGKISELSETTSSVMLVTHPGFKTGGMLRDSRINGIVAGTGDNMVKMMYLPMDTKVKNGDIVVTSNYSRIFPKGIIIGKVVAVGRSTTGLYKYAIIKPASDLFKLEEVLCAV
ncbi:MAG: rod shape-determining protein MreC [Candidatus Omnitrophota bacterium]